FREDSNQIQKTGSTHGSYLVKFAASLIQDIAVLKPRNIVNRVCLEVGAKVSYIAAWRSKAANKKHKSEEIDRSYQCIKPLLDYLLIANPKSITSFEVNNENQFVCIFICFLPWIKATEYCKPVFTIDAYHLKSSYNGVYFCTNIIEGDGKLVSVAFAIGSVENSTLHIEKFDEIMEEISDIHAEAAIYLKEIPSTT
ncbi:7611_t:CDS:2, partial [Dentiscutata erythropus]